jgi:hypothetical protein
MSHSSTAAEVSDSESAKSTRLVWPAHPADRRRPVPRDNSATRRARCNQRRRRIFPNQ